MADVLDDEAVARGIAGLDWRHEGAALVKELTFADFAEAMRYVNRIADAAEAANHHPDIGIRWNQVTLTLSTHSAGGITAKDLDMAATLDGIDR